MAKWILEIKVDGKWCKVSGGNKLTECGFSHAWEALQVLCKAYPLLCVPTLRNGIYEFLYARVRDEEDNKS